jgi:hypothetical protein
MSDRYAKAVKDGFITKRQSEKLNKPYLDYLIKWNKGKESQAEASERQAVVGLQGKAERVNEKGAEGADRGAESCPHCGAKGRHKALD